VQGVLVVPGAVPVVGDAIAEVEPPGILVVDDLDDDLGVVVLPRVDGGQLPGRGPDRGQDPAAFVGVPHLHLTVGGVVVVVAGSRVVGRDVLALAVVACPGVERGIDLQVTHLHPLEDRVSGFAPHAVREGELAGGGVHLGAGSETAAYGAPAAREASLVAVEPGPVRIGAAHAEDRAARPLAAAAAEVERQGGEAVLEPAQADHLETAVVVAVEVLRDDRVLVRRGDPVQVLVTGIAALGADGVAGHAVGRRPPYRHVENAADDHVGTDVAALRVAGQHADLAGAKGDGGRCGHTNVYPDLHESPRPGGLSSLRL
jgi:hypothetical protein